eukprot:CAMPEP_0117419020 /NCGR_PEP_ID=MMETSP0758-20121206/687_1 /TAXON_ID=63605 /ORGANISM="Percolomonas cosmopolitus, Strain AE-1 (ATCC 50343)" /LENGTH=688 /DNA_ID=CAMNT_0005199877 /DNA_START=354 /DNA_END=2420 /DNA_ORIENTATION=+
MWKWTEIKSNDTYETDPEAALNGGIQRKNEMFTTNEEKALSIHDDVITDLLILPHDNRLVSASQDSYIKVHDIEKSRTIRSFPRLSGTKSLQGHKEGVFGLAWNEQMHFLISAGFEHEALVWISNIRTTPFRLRDQRRPHQHSLVDVVSVPNSPQVITADNRGMVKIWDIRTLKCMQTIQIDNSSSVSFSKHEYHNFSLNSFVYIDQPHRQIVTSGRNISVFEYERTIQPSYADDNPIIFALYNRHALSFLTASDKSVKIWDALTGTMTHVYENLTTSEITSVCLDSNGRKFFIGTHDGEIIAFRFSNGDFVKKFKLAGPENLITDKYSKTTTIVKPPTQSREVTSLTYCTKLKTLIATTWEKGVYILSDRDPTDGILLKAFCTTDNVIYHRSDVKCSDFSMAHQIGATGDETSKVIIWDMQNFSKLGECTNPARGRIAPNRENIKEQLMRGSISCIRFLGTYPAFVCADSSGFLHLWTVKPYVYPNHKICSWRNYNDALKVTPQVTCIDFNPETNYLYTADDKGYVCVWDLEPLFEATYLRPKRNKKLRTNRKAQRFNKPTLRNDFVEKKMYWRAHQDSIKSLQVISDPASIFTASYSAEVNIWSSNGKKMDSISQERDESKPFNFPLDVQHRVKQEQSVVAGVINEIREKYKFLSKWRNNARKEHVDDKAFITQQQPASPKQTTVN